MTNKEELMNAIQKAINGIDLVCDSLLASGALSDEMDEDYNTLFGIAGYASDDVSGILRDMMQELKGTISDQELQESASDNGKEIGKMRSKLEVIQHTNKLLRDWDDGSDLFIVE